MERITEQLTSLCLIDNFGRSRSVNDEILYHCFIEACMYETANLGEYIDHYDQHKEKWFGFCHACNAQVCDKRTGLLMELKHWDKLHRLDENGISIPVQSEDGRTELQNAVNSVRAQRLNTNDGFTVDDEHGIRLKPWLPNPTLKIPENCRKMLSKKCLYALYKCMDTNCIFYTSNAESMATHLQDHQNDSAYNTYDSSWLECAYCDTDIDSCSSLVEHIQGVHGSSLYQCPCCFYRSCTAYNVVLHLRKFHESRINLVLVCGGMKLDTPEMTVIEANLLKNVFPLRCSADCNQITYLMDYFVYHTKNSSKHDNHFKCQFCGMNIQILEATEHLLIHRIGVYQCIYCIHGTNDIETMREHMCHAHPSQLPYICVRLTRKNRTLMASDLSSIKSTMVADLSKPVDSKWLEKCLFTDLQFTDNLLVPTTTTPNPNDPGTNGQDEIDGILSFNELEKDYTSNDWNKYFTRQASLFRFHGKLDDKLDDIDSPRHAENSVDTTDCDAHRILVPVSTSDGGSESELTSAVGSACETDSLSGRSSTTNEPVTTIEVDSACELSLLHCHLSSIIEPDLISAVESERETDSLSCRSSATNEPVTTIEVESGSDSTSALDSVSKTIVLRWDFSTINDSIGTGTVDSDYETDSHQNGPSTINVLTEIKPTGPSKPPEEVTIENVDSVKATPECTPSPMIHSVAHVEIPNSPALTMSNDNGVVVDRPNSKRKTSKKKSTPVNKDRKATESMKDEKQKKSATGGSVEQIALKLTDIFRYQCEYCPELFEHSERVHDHWKNKHNKRNAAFMFQIKKLFKCCYCRTSKSYDELRTHCRQKHPTETFAMVDKMNGNECGLCMRQLDSDSTPIVVDHFKECHTAADHTLGLENYLNDELLDRLTTEGIPDQMTSEIMYGCYKCPSRFSDELETVDHIRKHNRRFECNMCPTQFDFDKIKLMDQHHQLTHADDDQIYRVVNADKTLSEYFDMKIVFRNGLALTKKECENTRYGAMDNVFELVKKRNANDAAEANAPKSVKTTTKKKTKKKMKGKTKVNKERLPLKERNRTDDVDRRQQRQGNAAEKENVFIR